MKSHRMVRITAIAVLAPLAIILYADLRSVHQIYRITPATINAAHDAETRKALADDRDERDREEKRHRLLVGAGLAVDLAVLLVMVVGIVRSPRQLSSASQGGTNPAAP